MQTGQTEQDCQYGTGRTILLGQDRAGQDRAEQQDRIAETGQPEKKSQNKTA
jgi:hypothetical protein